MFRVETEGRLIKVQPTAGALWREEDGWIVMERVSAQKLAEQIIYIRSQTEDTHEPEDG